MARRLVAILVLLLVGCASEDDPMPAACSDSRKSMERALDAAPRPVALADGTRLSACVRRARTDSELQDLGLAMTTLAGELRARAPRDVAAAERLGYLIGAVRQGAAGSNGVALELARRMERTASLDRAPAAARAALQRGLRAGGTTG